MDNSLSIGLFDMDGSLADYEGSLLRELADLRSPLEPEVKDLWDEDEPHIRARMRMVKSVPGWWRNLPPMQNGLAIFYLAQELGFHNHILTKGPKKHSNAWQEKVDWCQSYLGPDIDIHITSDKGMVYGKFLYDDFPDYMLRWLKHRPRGLGIMPVTKDNKDFTHPQVIKWDGTNYEEVKAALEGVLNRKRCAPLTLCKNELPEGELVRLPENDGDGYATSAVFEIAPKRREMFLDLQGVYEFLERVRLITNNDLKGGHTLDVLLRNTVEELGEVAAAISIENGEKDKVLAEPAKVEMVDHIICALSLFYAKGGTTFELVEIAKTKLPKWESRVKKKLDRLSSSID